MGLWWRLRGVERAGRHRRRPSGGRMREYMSEHPHGSQALEMLVQIEILRTLRALRKPPGTTALPYVEDEGGEDGDGYDLWQWDA